jgi:hypothetical protein
MGKTCSSYEAMQNAERNVIEYPKERHQLGDLRVYYRIILKLILKK